MCGYIGYRLFVLCVFVSIVCTVTDFYCENKASGVKFCTVVHGRPPWPTGILASPE